MNEEDYQILELLKKKAVSLHLYTLACDLRDAQRKIIESKNDEFVKQVLNIMTNDYN